MSEEKKIYDAIVVGSGATGGWAAKELTEKGMEVLVLEAGRQVDPNVDFTEHKLPYEVKFRGRYKFFAKERPIQSRNYACLEYNYHFFVNDLENPYTTPEDKPFWWIRCRIVGGRTHAWGRQSYRLSDLDFKAASQDGYGEDWPISYADLAPYYDKVEQFIGVSGQEEGLPQLPDGKFLPPMRMTCGELLLRKVAKEKFGRVVTIGRCAILTKHHQGRFACHYCGPCERGCMTHSYFSSPFTVLAAAQKTGRLTLRPNSVVSHILVDANTGKAKGVHYVDRITRQHYDAYGKVVVLCASTLESTRIMLNSTSRQYPNGMANSSGVLGHYLMDHIFQVGASGILPQLKAEPWYGPPRRPNGIYIPRFRNVKDRHPKFIRGYGYQGGAHPGFNFGAPGFGADFKRAVKEGIWTINLIGFGECLARWENYVEIDKERVDAWGIPVLKINCSWSDNELKMAEDMAETAAEMLEAVGAEHIRKDVEPSVPGFAIHELGTARMGNDPKKSVLNKFNQAHDVKNLFVMDGSCFVSSACQNPTLTMMALTVRACEYLVEEYKRGNL